MIPCPPSSVVSIAMALGLALGASAAASARDCAFPGNPVPNCALATDLSDWIFTGDSVAKVPTDGASAPGCAQVERFDAATAIEAISDCTAITGGGEVGAGAAASLVSGLVEGCTFDLWPYSDAGCGAWLAAPFVAPELPTAVWRDVAGFFAVDAGAHSAQLRYACNSESEFVSRLDDFWLAPSIVRDDFEAGGLGAWSLATP